MKIEKFREGYVVKYKHLIKYRVTRNKAIEAMLKAIKK
jgi:hypothetical protein|tara:strand:- start:2253 stop:2366 length:114 start_codon:yes stop_codon:yes gene_type:complete